LRNESPPRRLTLKRREGGSAGFSGQERIFVNRVFRRPPPRAAESATLILRGPPRLPSPPHRHFFDSTRRQLVFAARLSRASQMRTRVCPRGCRLAVSWESRRVCTLVLEAVTLPCIAVLVGSDLESSPHLTGIHRHASTSTSSLDASTSAYIISSRSSRYLLRWSGIKEIYDEIYLRKAKS